MTHRSVTTRRARSHVACSCRPPAGLLAVGMLAAVGLLLSWSPGAWCAAAEEKPAAKSVAEEKAAAKAEAQPAEGKQKPDEPSKKKPAKKKDPFAWQNMFDGKTLKGWKVPKFGGDGEVKVEKGTIVLGMGDPMTGITWKDKDKLPRDNYEVTLEGKRTQGYDFFCTTTFPIGKEPCSFVVGGWAGTVVGLSCVDYYDASDNMTSQFMAFKDKQWYKIRIRVSETKVECWIDKDKKVDLVRKGHKFGIRDEVDLCRPFGICTWCTEGVVRNIKIRRLKPEEVKAIAKEAKPPY